MPTYDVLVVGAGPAGAAAARRCVQGGLKTLLVDKQKLPRRKACSGIITNLAQNYVLENFGPIPERTFGKPYAARGMCFYFPTTGPVFLDADCYAPYVWRDRFDHFLAKASGAVLRDRTRFVRMEEKDGAVEAALLRGGKPSKVRARYVVGADGGRSHVVHSYAPDVYRGMPWSWGCQKYYEGRVDADSRYLYWFLAKGMGPFPWLNIKDDQIIIGVAGVAGEKFAPRNRIFLDYLRKNLGLEIRREIATEGCFANMMTPLNRFFPGRGRVLMAGDAMGLMHQGGEGISCALASGGLAGEAIVQGLRDGTDPLPLYRKLVEPEMERALDQFNPFRMTESATSTMTRSPGLFAGRPLRERAAMAAELVGFVSTEFKSIQGLLPSVMRNTADRLARGRYRINTLH